MSGRAARFAACAALTLLPATAQGDERRELPDDQAASFHGVARLNVGGRRFCTATLISETRAVTAAHCLFHPRMHDPVPLEEMRLLAGLRRGEAVATRAVVGAAIPPDYVFDGMPSFDRVRRDIALIELDEAIEPGEAAAFPLADAPEGDAPIVIVSFARDRSQVASIQENCRLTAVIETVAALDCGVNFGASGAPVFVHEKGGLRLFAVVSATGHLIAGGEVTLAVLVAPELEALEELLVGPEPLPDGP